MSWIAKRVVRIQRNGKPVEIRPGEPVPEAEHWKNRRTCVELGLIAQVDDAGSPVTPEEPAKKPRAKPKARSK